jgi:hypothetical protein
LITVVTSAGTPTARKKKPNRAASAVSTPHCHRGSVGDASAASATTMTPDGIKYQPERPALVICSKTAMRPRGKSRAHVAAGTSSKNIAAITAPAMAIIAAIALFGKGGVDARAGRANARHHCARLSGTSRPKSKAGVGAFWNGFIARGP